jgi:hypothetical protein
MLQALRIIGLSSAIALGGVWADLRVQISRAGSRKHHWAACCSNWLCSTAALAGACQAPGSSSEQANVA